MKHSNPIFELMARWPSRQAFADEIGENIALVHKWARSGRIPSRCMAAVHAACQKRGFDYVTAEWLLAVHADPPTSSARTDQNGDNSAVRQEVCGKKLHNDAAETPSVHRTETMNSE